MVCSLWQLCEQPQKVLSQTAQLCWHDGPRVASCAATVPRASSSPAVVLNEVMARESRSRRIFRVVLMVLSRMRMWSGPTRGRGRRHVMNTSGEHIYSEDGTREPQVGMKRARADRGAGGIRRVERFTGAVRESIFLPSSRSRPPRTLPHGL